jgi:hypothetical protein
MNDNPHHPYTLEVSACERPAGHWAWAIRRQGRLLERSDRPHHSESSARKKGEEALERQIRGERAR